MHRHGSRSTLYYFLGMAGVFALASKVRSSIDPGFADYRGDQPFGL